MLRSLALHSLLALLLSTCGLGESRPRLPPGRAPGLDGEGSHRALLLEALKAGLLSSMGLEREPVPGERDEGREEEEEREGERGRMPQLYRETLRQLRGNSSQARGDRHHSAQKISTVLLPDTVDQMSGREEEQADPDLRWYRAVFHQRPNLRRELVLTWARLRLYRQLLDTAGSPGSGSKPPGSGLEVQVRVYESEQLNSTAARRPEHLLPVQVSSSGAVSVDVRPVVERWRGGGPRGWALVVEVGLPRAREEGGRAGEAAPRAALELGLASGGRSRGRRSNEEASCEEEGFCCRKSLSVSFKEIGWSDWVVAPAGYTMHYCDGACPHNYRPASMHAQVKSRLHHLTGGTAPRPCCVPSQFEPLVLMHYNSRGKLKVTTFNDLVVSSCHCA